MINPINTNKENTTFYIVNISEFDMEALVRIRNYFGENDKSQLEHLAYDVLKRITKSYKNETDETPKSS